MALPFFYKEDIDASPSSIVLDEDTSKHIVQVLRMQPGEQIQLTDGKGNLLTCEIVNDNRKKCEVKTIKRSSIPGRDSKVSIAISLLKNTSRFEWFLEKAVEIGVREIIPLVCSRTEKITFKADRMKSILVSAMLQSQQTHLLHLHEPIKFEKFVPTATQQQKFIAHCMDETKRSLVDLNNRSLSSKIILIGPEGDFTKEEVNLALQHHFSAAALGDTRLRTETAGVVAATLLCLV